MLTTFFHSISSIYKLLFLFWFFFFLYFFLLKLSEKKFTRLCSTKSMLVVNESFPGPVIHVHRGHTVYLSDDAEMFTSEMHDPCARITVA